MKYCLLDNDTLILFEGLFFDDGKWNDRDAIVLGAIDENNGSPMACGTLRAFLVEEVVSVDWLFVRKEYRHQGIGKGMISVLMESVKKNVQGCSLQLVYSADDHDVEGFMSSLGFDIDSSIRCYNSLFNYLDVDRRIKLLSVPKEICFLKDLTARMINSFNNSLSHMDEIDRLSYTIRSPLSEYDENSLCYIRDDQVVAFLLLDNSHSLSVVSINSVYSRADAIRELATVWAALYRRLSEIYPEGINMVYSSFDSKKNDAITRLFSNAKTEIVCYNEIKM